MARQQLSSPFQSFVAGREARQQHDYGQTRNKLAEMELADAPAQMQRRNALADVQLQGAQVGLEGAQQQLGAEKAQFAYAKLQQALDSGDPKAFITSQIPDLAAKLQQQGIDIASMDGREVAQFTEQLARKYAGEAGIAPAQPKTPEAFTLGAGQTRYGPDGKPIASAPVSNEMTPYQQERLKIEREKLNRPEKSAGAFRPLTPQEVTDAGLPPGTSAQLDERTGKIDVLSKRDNSGTLSQKDANTAKLKLTTIRVARKQLADIKKAFDEGRAVTGPNSFGPGQGMLPTERGKKFDAAVDRMRSTLTALTRVPGVGAMSDYETKLDQGKFPNRNAYESVTTEQIQGIEDLLSTIESGYAGLLSGESPSQDAAQPSGGPQPGAVEDGYRFKGGDPADPNSWERM
jgi:hypothetical protein